MRYSLTFYRQSAIHVQKIYLRNIGIAKRPSSDYIAANWSQLLGLSTLVQMKRSNNMRYMNYAYYCGKSTNKLCKIYKLAINVQASLDFKHVLVEYTTAIIHCSHDTKLMYFIYVNKIKYTFNIIENIFSVRCEIEIQFLCK